ncbi:MAG: ligase-associated DNA damage response exonuclease [Aureliella sp.]
MDALLKPTLLGLYCPAADFYVDPRQPVERAVVTHAHADHARWGCRHYLAAKPGEHLLRLRMSPDANFQFVEYGKSVKVNGVDVSFHPAGHMLGSAQVRLEYEGRVAVISGDYKLGDDPTCASWEPVQCDLFVTESTFGLPVYRWESERTITAFINQWWCEGRERGKCCVLYGYAIGKSQRLLACLDPTIGPIYTHGAVEKGVEAYRKSGVQLPPTTYVGSIDGKHDWKGGMVIAVPSAHGTPWMRKFGLTSTAMASGWMGIRGARRRRAVDRGFVLSDHVDWPSLLTAIEECNPETVWVTHGYSAAVARYLNEIGRNALAIDHHSRTENDEDNS